MAAVVMDSVVLDRLYQQALSKAAAAPSDFLTAMPHDLCVVEELLAT